MSRVHLPSPRRAPVLGLTGAAGAGKSTAAAMFAECGCAVLDVDRMGHEALDAPAVRDAVVAAFGARAAGADGRLDRRALAEIAFADAAALRRLEAIVHPAVRATLEKALAGALRAAPRAVVVDCALLFEAAIDSLCDVTIVVEAPEPVRARRVAAARGWTPEELARREAAQFPAEKKRERADRALANDGGADELRRRVRALLDELAPATDRSRADAAAGRSQ